MGLNYTEEQLKEMLKKNSNLKISSVIGGDKPLSDSILTLNQMDKIKVKETNKLKKYNKIQLSDNIENIENKKPKAVGVNVTDINKLNKSAIPSSSVSDIHLSLLFTGAKLLSVNQIFAILQYRKYEIFTYKKIWHDIIKQNLDAQYYDLKALGRNLPYFDDSVEITLFRQASRLVDEDAMSTMFKYIIDGLKRDPIKNPHGILAEDNPKIVHRIVCYSEKGEPAVGIKVKKLDEKKRTFSAQDILTH
ncbi:hypothetical protein GW796_10590 [archaeon]|nr:hypothetical protein [archaeon]